MKKSANPQQKTLERVLSKAGIGSRTEARSWIHARRVKVNGRIVENPDQWVDFQRDKVSFDDRPLEVKEKRYLLLYKPKGYITTYKDPEGRSTVYDLLTDIEQFVSPVGRLDQDTSGLLILTNDTQFSERLTNPEFHVPKTYLVKCASILDDVAIALLRNGVELDDGPTRPAHVRRVRDSESKTFLELTITEGRNRQVRRMIEAVGSRVLKLVRTRIGTIQIGDLAIGKWRDLTPSEVRMLKQESHGRGVKERTSVREGTGDARRNRKAARKRGRSSGKGSGIV